LAYVGNIAGAVGAAGLVFLAGQYEFASGAVGKRHSVSDDLAKNFSFMECGSVAKDVAQIVGRLAVPFGHFCEYSKQIPAGEILRWNRRGFCLWCRVVVTNAD
jgi:hypothetical protein